MCLCVRAFPFLRLFVSSDYAVPDTIKKYNFYKKSDFFEAFHSF